MGRLQLERAAAQYKLLALNDEALPALAREALHSGLKSGSLEMLASARDAGDNLHRLFLQSLEELDIPLPTRTEAVALVAKDIARQIVGKEISPFMGVMQVAPLVRASGELLSDYPAEVREMYGLAEEYLASSVEEHGQEKHDRLVEICRQRILAVSERMANS